MKILIIEDEQSVSAFMHYDVEEIIKNFEISTESKNIHLEYY